MNPMGEPKTWPDFGAAEQTCCKAREGRLKSTGGEEEKGKLPGEDERGFLLHMLMIQEFISGFAHCASVADFVWCGCVSQRGGLA